jgi:hypothetical protein
MTPALSAKLFELESIRRLLLVLGRDVIPVLALGTLQRDVVSWHKSLLICHLLFAICHLLFAFHYLSEIANRK